MHFLFHEWFRVHGWYLIFAIVWPAVTYWLGIAAGRRG